MASEKASFHIEIRYDESSAGTAEIQALAEILQRRGHVVSTRKTGGSAVEFVRDLAKSARDIKGMAENFREAAESGMQMIRGIAESFALRPSDKPQESAANKPAEGFDDIGPAKSDITEKSESKEDDNRAVIVTNPNQIDASCDALRIGFLPKTALDGQWQPMNLDAIVTPHKAFRPYLESIHWDAGRIFEGGYLALKKDCPNMSHEDAMTHFKLNAANGPVLLVMASGFDISELQTLIIQLSLIKLPMQIFFYHAGDNAKAAELRAQAQKYGVNARMFGHVECLPDYLAMADIAVCRSDDPNGQLLQNAAVPTVYAVHREAPARLNFLAHENAAILVPQLLRLSAALATPIADVNYRAPYKNAADNIAKLASIELCADAIEAALAKKKELAPQPARHLVDDAGFETIGNIPNAFPQPTVAPAQPNEVVIPQTVVSIPQTVVSMPQQTAFLQPPAPAPTVVPVAPAPGTFPPPAPFLTPGLGSRSREELHSDYAKLLMAEKNLDKSLATASADVKLWEQRLDLARTNNREDLVADATAHLQTAQNQEMQLYQQKDQIQQQKSILKQSARLIRGDSPSSAFNFADPTEAELFGPSTEEQANEKEYKKLENENALKKLKEQQDNALQNLKNKFDRT